MIQTTRGFSTLAIIIILTILLAGGGAAYVVTQSDTTPNTIPVYTIPVSEQEEQTTIEGETNATPTKQNTSQEQTIVTSDPLSDWKTYHNEEYGFEFKYPAEWDLAIPAVSPTSMHLSPTKIVFPEAWGGQLTSIVISVVSDQRYEDSLLFRGSKDNYRDFKQLDLFSEGKKIGETFQGISISSGDDYSYGLFISNSYINLKGEHALIVSYKSGSEVPDNSYDVYTYVLSTFKFVDSPEDHRVEFSWTKDDIFINGEVVLNINDFPDRIEVSPGTEFGSSDRIADAKVSPDGRWVAVAVSGAAHDFGWLYNIEKDELTFSQFSYGGGVRVDRWVNNNEVEFKITTPKPESFIKKVSMPK